MRRLPSGVGLDLPMSPRLETILQALAVPREQGPTIDHGCAPVPAPSQFSNNRNFA